jgi:hypothetical protein
MFASSVIDLGCSPRSGPAKEYAIGMCCFCAKHAALRSKRRYWLVRNSNNFSERSDMSIRRLLFHWASNINIQLSWFRTKRTSSSSHWKLTCSRHDIAKTNAGLGLDNNHLFTHSFLVYMNSAWYSRSRCPPSIHITWFVNTTKTPLPVCI